MVSVIALILTLCSSVLFVNPAHAVTRYVDVTGSDSNDGLSEASPKFTLAHTVPLMLAGDTTYVRGGTYNETTTVRFSRSGTQVLPIKLLAYPNERPIINFVNVSSSHPIMMLIDATSQTTPIGWITIQGFEINGAWVGLKWDNLHNSEIRHNWFRNSVTQGILGGGGHHNVIDRNIITHTGEFGRCEAVGGAQAPCDLQHGLYAHGDSYIVTNNLIYDNLSYGIQHNGSPSGYYSASQHPSPDFAEAKNWIIAENTIAYNNYKGGIVEWGSRTTNTRIENNIFYENAILKNTTPNGIDWVSPGTTSGVQIRNNHFFASSTGGTLAIGTTATEGVHYTQSGNVVNVSAPALTSGNSNTLPGSPDFTLTASAPVNIARTNEFPNNSTGVVGAFKIVPNPSCTITANRMTCIFPMNTAVPIQNLSTAGVTIGCTGSACPGSPTASAVSRPTGTDTHVEITIDGIAGNACEAANQNWTLSYNSGAGSWTANDHIGPYPGLHQKILSITDLTVMNACDGTPQAGYPAGATIFYNFNEGTGTTATNGGSSGAGDNGTLTNGPTWGAGKTGSGVVMTGNNTEHVAIPYGSGVNPTSQSLTIAFGVNIPEGNQSLGRQYFGAPLDSAPITDRLYISTLSGQWKIGIQGSNDSIASDLAVTSGWNHVCLTLDKDTPGGGTGTATLHLNGQAGTASGAVKTYTSYTFAGDFDLGRIADQATGGGGGTYDDPIVYESVEDCNEIYQAFQAEALPTGDTLTQAAVQIQSIYLVDGSPVNLAALNTAKTVVARGAVVLLFQLHCENVEDCAATSFKLAYRKNGSLTHQFVPDVETAGGVWFWGLSTDPLLNSGSRPLRLTGSCTETTGSTQLTSAQVPNVDLPQNGCVTLGYIVKFGEVAGDEFDFKLLTESGIGLTGGYDVEPHIEVIGAQASAGP